MSSESAPELQVYIYPSWGEYHIIGQLGDEPYAPKERAQNWEELEPDAYAIVSEYVAEEGHTHLRYPCPDDLARRAHFPTLHQHRNHEQ